MRPGRNRILSPTGAAVSQPDTTGLDTSGRVLTGWNPEEPENWSAAIAWRTLVITTYSMILAFCVWIIE